MHQKINFKQVGFVLTTTLILSACGGSSSSSSNSNDNGNDTSNNGGSITHNGTTYGTVKSPYTGRIWLDRNLGAARVCESYNDTACYGDYYQWGRNADGHQDSRSATTETQATDINSPGSRFIKSFSVNNYDWAQEVDGDGRLRSTNWVKTDGSSVCPVGYRVPTSKEFNLELFDVDSAEIQNRDDAFKSFLKLPSAGYRNAASYSAKMTYVGSQGIIWTSTVNRHKALSIKFNSDTEFAWNSSERADGFSVRCLRD